MENLRFVQVFVTLLVITKLLDLPSRLVCRNHARLHLTQGSGAEWPKLNLQLFVDDREPLFQGNITRLRITLHHDTNSSVATKVSLHIEVSFEGNVSDCAISPGSMNPDQILQNEIKFNTFQLQDEFSAGCNVSVDPKGLAQPGHVHVSHVIVTLTYSRHHDNCTDPTSGEMLESATETNYRSFFFYVLDTSCTQPLGMRSGRIKESQIQSSSFHKDSNDSHGRSPHQARLGGEGYWTPVGRNISTDGNQFLQINFELPVRLKLIAVQGKPNSTAHVKLFDVFTSPNGDVWRKEKALLPKADITVNSGDTAVPTAYQNPTAIRFLRINPTSWYKESALRVEIYGCVQPKKSTEEFSALGVEKALISDAQMTSSSSLDPPKTNASSGRLNFNSSWCSATSDEIPLFLQIDLGEIHFITAASSQSRDTNSGSFDSVMSYKLRYSTEGVTWTFYQQNGIDKIFLGNLVEHFTTKNHLALPVKARYVQFYPVSMINSACMRVELYGEKSLEENTDIPPVYQRSFLLDSENRRLFVCNKDVPRGKPACYLNKYGVKEGWLALDRRMVSILGYSKMKDMIYGVAPNRRSYVRCNVTKCMTVVKTSWLAERESQTTVLATEIAFIPVTGHDLTDAPISVYNLNDAESNTWSASAVGLHFQEAPSQTWELKARWRAKDLNECYSSPCENGGSCVGDYKNYTCICTKDWLGRNCEIAHTINLNECYSSPCENGGTCVGDYKNYTCACTKAWLGRNCKIAHHLVHKCYSSPCENGGTCVGDYKNYTCTCTKDWLGRNCEIAHNVVPPTLTVYISAASCSGTRDDANRIIKSPGYPSSYSDNEDCTWELVSSHRIKLTFTYFVTEANYDYLYVYDGDSTSSQFEKWSGVNTGEVVTSTGQNLFLKFTTDGSVINTGFTINFKAIE